MGIDHRGLYILVTEKFLDGPNVVTAFEQVRGEGVPECVTCGVLRQSRSGDSLPLRLYNHSRAWTLYVQYIVIKALRQGAYLGRILGTGGLGLDTVSRDSIE